MKILEVIIVLIITGILFSLGLVSFHSITERGQISILKQTIRHAFDIAREKAEMERGQVGLCLIDHHRQCRRDGTEGLMVFSVASANHVMGIYRIFPFNHKIKGTFYLSSFPIHRSYLRFSGGELMSHDNGHIAFTSTTQASFNFKFKMNKVGGMEMTK